MARPRSLSDEEVLEGAARVIGRKGPLQFTLRDVSDEVGLAPATLLQRFRTKHGLLVALVRHAAGAVDGRFSAARTDASSPLAALLDALAAGASRMGKPEEVANHLAFLQLDITDPDLRPHAQAFFLALRRNVQALLEEAIASRDLPRHADAARLAQAVEVAYHGALLTWAVRGQGRAEDAVRDAVGLVLDAATPRPEEPGASARAKEKESRRKR